MKRILASAMAACCLLCGCTFQQQADQKFGDQNFKTAIALIELYHLRNGAYPMSLDDLSYTGDWDRLALSSVQYQRQGDGYELDIRRGWVGQPALSYPADFWKNLGIVKTNVAGKP